MPPLTTGAFLATEHKETNVFKNIIYEVIHIRNMLISFYVRTSIYVTDETERTEQVFNANHDGLQRIESFLSKTTVSLYSLFFNDEGVFLFKIVLENKPYSQKRESNATFKSKYDIVIFNYI